jgi:hypothetical protein
MFHPATAIRLLRETLNVVTTEWVLWAIDASGVFWLHEGPGVWQLGMRPGELLGHSAWERYADEEGALAFLRDAQRAPTTREIALNGRRVQVSGAPDTLGGVSGVALVMRAAAAEAGDGCVVLEASRCIPEIGADRGDLLVVDPHTMGRVGVYRSVEIAALPEAVGAELAELSRGSGAAAGLPGGGADARRPLRGPVAHLRLLP